MCVCVCVCRETHTGHAVKTSLTCCASSHTLSNSNLDLADGQVFFSFNLFIWKITSMKLSLSLSLSYSLTQSLTHTPNHTHTPHHNTQTHTPTHTRTNNIRAHTHTQGCLYIVAVSVNTDPSGLSLSHVKSTQQ